MPKTIYASLNLEPLKEFGIIIELIDRTNVYPDGFIEDVLIQVNKLVFPANMYILDMNDENSPNPLSILLSRSFFSTAQTKINVSKGTLTVEFGEEAVHFNIFNAMKDPSESNSLFAINVTNRMVLEVFELNYKNKLGDIETKPLESVIANDVELIEELTSLPACFSPSLS